jgi:acyl-CoA synthetase (AMP-forming)/AMP-acid ligase II
MGTSKHLLSETCWLTPTCCKSKYFRPAKTENPGTNMARNPFGIADLMYRVAVLCTSGYNYVQSMFGVWRSGGVFVPLCTTHPESELSYVIEDSDANLLMCDKKFEPILTPIAQKHRLPCLTVTTEHHQPQHNSDALTPDALDQNADAMMLYTRLSNSRAAAHMT